LTQSVKNDLIAFDLKFFGIFDAFQNRGIVPGFHIENTPAAFALQMMVEMNLMVEAGAGIGNFNFPDFPFLGEPVEIAVNSAHADVGVGTPHRHVYFFRSRMVSKL
jgi:hypothetical protein